MIKVGNNWINPFMVKIVHRSEDKGHEGTQIHFNDATSFIALGVAAETVVKQIREARGGSSAGWGDNVGREPAPIGREPVDPYPLPEYWDKPPGGNGNHNHDAANARSFKDDHGRTINPPVERSIYTGNACVTCNSTRMIRTGPCETCQDCGTNTGCS